MRSSSDGSYNRNRKKKEHLTKVTDVSGEPPCTRHGHSAIVEEKGGGVMILFGGCNQHGVFLSDLYFYNIENKEWHKAENTNGVTPYGRQYHSAVLYDGYMYIFAGNSNGYYNDLHSFHIDTETWQLVKPLGTAPSPRAGHSAVVHGNAMYIFGGYDKNGLSCHDLHEFSFNTMTWRLVATKGIIPNDVYHHSAVVNQGSMYIFGGYRTNNNYLFEYRFGTCTWSIVNTTGTTPSPRWGHRMIVFNNTLYVFGGRDAVANFSDLFEFHFSNQEWKKSSSDNIEARFFASMALHDQIMYIFGGANIFNFSFGELYQCDLVKMSSPCTLIEDFKGLLNDPELADVIFYFPNEPLKGVIFAHKSILVGRCKPFGAMFQSGMKESRKGEIVISNINYDAFYSVLEYLYTGQLFSVPSDLLSILHAADLYQLEHLKRTVERKLERYVDLVNAIYMFQTAEKFKAFQLKSYCLKFIVKNYLQLQNTESYQMLDPDHHSEINRSLNVESLLE